MCPSTRYCLIGLIERRADLVDKDSAIVEMTRNGAIPLEKALYQPADYSGRVLIVMEFIIKLYLTTDADVIP